MDKELILTGYKNKIDTLTDTYLKENPPLTTKVS